MPTILFSTGGFRTKEKKKGESNGDTPRPNQGGAIGSLPIPRSTLEEAVRGMMESPENREKLKLPADLSDLRIENGEVVVSYK